MVGEVLALRNGRQEAACRRCGKPTRKRFRVFFAGGQGFVDMHACDHDCARAAAARELGLEAGR